MVLKKTKYSTNFWLNNYLSNFDLLSKYKLKTTYQLPKIEKIILSLPLTKISYSENNKKYINSVPAQRILFFFFFSLFTVKPFIKGNTLPTMQRALKINENDFNLFLIFTTSKQIEIFIFYFFIEAWLNLIKNGYKFYFNKPFFLIKKNFTELNSKLPLAAFYNFNMFFNPVTNQLIKEDSSFFITFQFKNLFFLNNKKCIQNLPYFWKKN